MTIDEHGNPDTNEDPEAAYLKSIVETNHLCCDILVSGGYGGDLLRVTPSITPRNDQRKAKITQPHTKERQDVLTNSKSQGEKFLRTGGVMLNSDDYFIAEERVKMNTEIKCLEEKKESHKAACKRKHDATEILSALSKRQEEWQKSHSKRKKPNLTSPQLKKLIEWKQNGKGAVPDKVDERRAIWADIQNNESPDDYTWSEEDELDLKKNQEQVESLTINDTDYGRNRALREHETKAAFVTMSSDDKYSLFSSIGGQEIEQMYSKWKKQNQDGNEDDTGDA